MIIPYLEINKLVCYYFMDAGRKQNTTWSEPGLHCFWSWCSKRPELQHTCVGSLSQVPLVVKNMPANTGDMRLGFDPWVGRIPWRRAWQPNPVVLPGESLEQKSLVGYSPRVTKSRPRLTHFQSLSLSLSLFLLVLLLVTHKLSLTWNVNTF